MKKLAIIFSLILSILSFAQTQTEMNIESYNQYLKVDKELNVVYNQILKKYSSDKVFLKKLKISQNLWVKFRDAEAEAKGRRKKQSKFRTSHKGGDSAGDPPLPIPNREVKPRYADGTAKVGE